MTHEIDRIENNKNIDGSAKRVKCRKIIVIVTVIIVFMFVAVLSVIAIGNMVFKTLLHNDDKMNLLIYGEYNGRLINNQNGLWSGLYVFPEKLPKTAKVDEYFVYGKSAFFDNAFEYYLKISMSKNDFISEIERLKSISCEIKNPSNSDCYTNYIEYDETNFNYPAYVTVYASHDTYEYALIDEDNLTIIYVYLQMILKKSDVKFEHSYLPKSLSVLEEFGEIPNSWENPNIYYHSFDGGDSYVNLMDSVNN